MVQWFPAPTYWLRFLKVLWVTRHDLWMVNEIWSWRILRPHYDYEGIKVMNENFKRPRDTKTNVFTPGDVKDLDLDPLDPLNMDAFHERKDRFQ